MTRADRIRAMSVRCTCDNCGDRKCRRQFRAVCWLHCGKWKPEILPLEAVLTEESSKES